MSDQDTSGRDHSMAVPIGIPFKLWVYSRSLKIQDGAANDIDATNHAAPFQAAASVTRLDYVYSVTGVK